MKRFSFLAVTGAAALAAGFTVPAAAVAKPIVRLPVLETDWIMSHNNMIWFKRYFVKNPPGAPPGKPHLANAVTMSFDEWHSPDREKIQQNLDELAKMELREWITDGVNSPNVVLFGKDDCLPVMQHPNRA